MKNLTLQNLFSAMLVSSIIFVSSCDGGSEDEVVAPVASFTSAIDGKTVAFTNTSTGEGVTYAWDFGDGESSTDAAPSHTFDANGSYLVKLTATNEAGSDDSQAVLEIINIAIDGDLSDWDDVAALVEYNDGEGGFLTKLKVENLENNKLFVYVEANDEMNPLNAEEGTVIQILLDVDNDATTGADVCWLYNQAGEDFLMEGTFLGAEGTLAFIQDNGTEGCGWNWAAPISTVKDDYIVAADLVTISGGFAYELSIDLSAFPTTVAGAGISTEAIRIAVHHNYQWAANSFIPMAYNETTCPTCSLASYTLK